MAYAWLSALVVIVPFLLWFVWNKLVSVWRHWSLLDIECTKIHITKQFCCSGGFPCNDKHSLFSSMCYFIMYDFQRHQSRLSCESTSDFPHILLSLYALRSNIGLLPAITGLAIFWYPFVITNIFQGVFIFFIFGLPNLRCLKHNFYQQINTPWWTTWIRAFIQETVICLCKHVN